LGYSTITEIPVPDIQFFFAVDIQQFKNSVCKVHGSRLIGGYDIAVNNDL